MKVEIWTDIMCPYCYIGKKLYEKALREFPHADELELQWKAFQLNPDLPGNGHGIPVTDYLRHTARMSEEEMEQMFQHIEKLANETGIVFNLRNAIAANTLDAHRLIKLSAEKGVANDVVSALSKAYFEEAKDYSDHKVLTEIAIEAGIDESEVSEMLASDQYAYEVKQDIQEIANLGFDTVPFFLFDRKEAIIGSEPLEIFINTLHKAYANQKSSRQKTTKMNIQKGRACNADGTCEI